MLQVYLQIMKEHFGEYVSQTTLPMQVNEELLYNPVFYLLYTACHKQTVSLKGALINKQAILPDGTILYTVLSSKTHVQ